MSKTTVPKVEYAKAEKQKLSPRAEVALMQRGRQPLSAEDRDFIREIAERYDLPIQGIILLGGKPYVNMTGLDDKVKKSWLSNGYVKSEVSNMIQRAKRENKYLAGCECVIEMFNEKAFTEALQNLVKVANESLTSETIQTLKKVYTVSFKSEGWASPDTCEGIAYKYEGERGRKTRGNLLVENVNMMAERKASNRAKRAATSCGLTSVEEVAGVDSAVIDTEYQIEKEAPKKAKLRDKKESLLKKEDPGKEKVREDTVAKEEPEEKCEKAERPVQTSDIPFKKGAYDPKGPPTEWQWGKLDEIKERLDSEGWREVLDDMSVVLESELTLEKADKIIKKADKIIKGNPTGASKDDELPLEN